MELNEAMARRWSPREFTARKVDEELLAQVFDAARWAQSSYNEQPWRYVFARKDGGALRQKLEGYLVEGNAFAKEAWVLGVAFARLAFSRNEKPNRVAVHDVGAANQLLALKAWELGLNTRFMAGFDHERAQELAPKEFSPQCMFVIGYASEAALRQGPGDRGRRAVGEYVFDGAWGKGLRADERALSPTVAPKS
jgi:nitroreductase